MNIFLDTNVLLDVLPRRELFYEESARIWTLAERKHVTGFVSALSLPNVHYVLRRAGGSKPARTGLRLVRDIFSLVPLDAQIVNRSIDSDIPDFEDAIQFFCALRAGAGVLVTRNPKDFPRSGVAIQTPGEFLTTHFPHGPGE